MANQIIIPAQIMSAQELVNSISGNIKKIFFQCEITGIKNNDVTCRIIAYAARKNSSQKWDVGKCVKASIDNTKPAKKFSIPISFGNCEWINTKAKKKRKGESKKAFNLRISQAAAINLLNRMANNKSKLAKTKLIFRAGKSSNPHLDFTVTIDSGIGSPTSAYANPSPPAPPAE
jgi:hypothetical protein